MLKYIDNSYYLLHLFNTNQAEIYHGSKLHNDKSLQKSNKLTAIIRFFSSLVQKKLESELDCLWVFIDDEFGEKLVEKQLSMWMCSSLS